MSSSNPVVLGKKIKKNGFRGAPKIVLVELLYSVSKFCKDNEMNRTQYGALISIFYYTHAYFTRDLYVSAERVYFYFRNLLMKYCLFVSVCGNKWWLYIVCTKFYRLHLTTSRFLHSKKVEK